jgi:hypothetical protein
MSTEWQDSVAQNLREFGWQQGKALQEIGGYFNIPNRTSLSPSFMAAALEFKKQFNKKYPGVLDEVIKISKSDKERTAYPSAIIPEVQKTKGEKSKSKKIFPPVDELEAIIDKIKIPNKKLAVGNRADPENIRLREKDELVSYFLMILDFEAFGSSIKETETQIKRNDESSEGSESE